uniref:Uncharacterized protein n=1 Tax=Anguilla anguilla TaxID=7936 RepID=A0A0E9PQ95_ANGAN
MQLCLGIIIQILHTTFLVVKATMPN